MFDFPQIALAQINPIVGDIAGNTAKILDAWKKASEQGAKLVVFPELCVTGYPPEDLILMPDFRKKAMEAVQYIAQKTKDGAAIIVGSVWEYSVIPNECEESLQRSLVASLTRDDKGIYNAAILLDAGKIVHIQAKTMLPNYGIFDEKRLFAAGNGVVPFVWRNHKIAMLICEDVWHEAVLEPLENQELEAVFVINASPFETGKYETRINIVTKAVSSIGCAIYYVNMVGGQDDIVFDGGSFAITTDKEIIEYLRFAEEIIIPHSPKQKTILSKYDVLEETWNAMKLGLADYVRKNGFSKVLLGLSGGIDSALTVACAVDALGADNVLGVLLPSPYTSQDSIGDALESAKLLGIETKTISITSGMETFETLLTPEFAKKDWMENPEIGGNLQARLRGVILMGLSNNTGSLLLSTGNKSEIAVGYSTLYGDSCGAYNVLKDVYKTKVYELANWRNAQSQAIPLQSISKAPSAELKPNQRDDDSLPPYDVLDDILEKHIEKRLSEQEIIDYGHEIKIVQKVLKLVRLSEYKRRQSCAGVKITPMLFGKDRRYPISNKF